MATETIKDYDAFEKDGMRFDSSCMCSKIIPTGTIIKGCPDTAKPMFRPIVGADNKYYYTACKALCGSGSGQRCYKEKIERKY